MKSLLRIIGYNNCVDNKERLLYMINLSIQLVLILFAAVYFFYYHSTFMASILIATFVMSLIATLFFSYGLFFPGKMILILSLMCEINFFIFFVLPKEAYGNIYLLAMLPTIITIFRLDIPYERHCTQVLIAINFVLLLASEVLDHPTLLTLSPDGLAFFRLSTLFSVAIILSFLFYYFTIKTTADHKSLSLMAMTDTLTNIPNRRIFFAEGYHLFHEAVTNSDYFGLVIFDIDHFKTINDTYGHPVGDIILRELTDLIKTKIRQNDVFARIGGEEFAILFDNTNSITLKMKAEEICHFISKMPFRVDNNLTVKLTISIGAVNYSDSMATFDEMVEIADNNLYKAKGNGRNQVSIKIV